MTARVGVVNLGASIARRPRCVALAGNPNVGKSSLFNHLTGLRQKVTNYPGVTVERREGTLAGTAAKVRVVDLPGTYSLHARSIDERVARDELLGRVPGSEPPDVVVVVADAARLERSLFLVTQILATGCHAVVALNQCDLAVIDGVTIDPARLSAELGVPVVPTSGRTGGGADDLRAAIMTGGATGRALALDHLPEIRAAAEELAPLVGDRLGPPEAARSRLAAALGSEGGAADLLAELGGDPAAGAFAAARADLARRGIDVATATAAARYGLVGRIAAAATTASGRESRVQARLDRVLTHPVLGTIVLVAVFAFLFRVVFSWSGPAIDAVDGLVGDLGGALGGLFGDGLLAAFVQDGVVAGIGAFLVFVPQIAMLFVCIEALEDTGYLARAAFLLDRVMGAAGLPGRAFLPLLSGFACAIPGLMAARAIEDRRDRFVTMAVLPLMSCSARLPVYAVVVGALFTQFGGWVPSVVVLAMYVVGIVFALVGAKLLRKTILRGGRSPLLLELPPYRRPSVRTVLRNTTLRTWSFVKGAGPIILVLSMGLWVTLTFPRDVEFSRDYDAAVAAVERRASELPPGSEAADGLLAERRALLAARSAERLAHTYMGRSAQLLEPVIEPLGFDWKIGVAVLGSFAAREVFVPTLGVIYAVGEEAGEDDPGLLAKMRRDRWPDGRPVFTPLVGISLLVFYVLAMQCMSTLAVMKRETNSWRWPIGVFVVLTGVAYLASLLVFQVGSLLGF